MVEADAVEVLRAEVRRLRRSAWAWRAAGLLALAWAVARPVGAVGPQAGPKRIAAELLTIVDDRGRERIVMTATEDGPGLWMFDAKGTARVQLGLGEDGHPNLNLSDSKLNGRFQLGVSPHADEPPYMDAFDRKGTAFPLLDKAGKPIR